MIVVLTTVLLRIIAMDLLPAQRVTVRFKFTGIPAAYRGFRTFWLLLEPSHADLCVEDPGHEIDLYVTADLATMIRLWLGDARFEGAVEARKVQLEGKKTLVKAFPSWLKLSHFAAVPRPGAASGEVTARESALPHARGTEAQAHGVPVPRAH